MNRFIRLKGIDGEFNDTYVRIDFIAYIEEHKELNGKIMTYLYDSQRSPFACSNESVQEFLERLFQIESTKLVLNTEGE